MKTNKKRLKTLKGWPAANHWIISNARGEYLQSYRSIVAFKSKEGEIILGEDWGYSRTTLKYVRQFLEISSSKAEIEKAIKQGIYKLDTQLFKEL